MIPKYTQQEFDAAKATDKLTCECEYCHKLFTKEKRFIKRRFNNQYYKNVSNYCSIKCKNKAYWSKTHPKTKINCCNCGNEIYRAISQVSKNNFCSHSCAAIYHNTHKTTGNRRSKLEKYLEEQLTILYPKLEIHYNQKDAINSELDIYIPSLHLAFELNGIFHYEPIYGNEKLQQIQNNDQRKFQACLENNIELCIIDASSFSYFKKEHAQKYLNIISNIISDKISKI